MCDRPSVRCLLASCLLVVSCLASACASMCAAADLEWIRVSDDRQHFVLADSGRRFVPWGFNYDHDEAGRLIEDYWESDWPKIAADFQEMQQLGANVVRVHLQFGRFMRSPRREWQ